jgi:hypothetical protein
MYQFQTNPQQINGLIEYLKRNPQEIEENVRYVFPTFGRKKISQQTRKNQLSFDYGQGFFYQLFPSDLHQKGDIETFEYQKNAFKYGFYHSMIDQYIKKGFYSSDIQNFFELFENSPILQILGATYIKKKIQDEKQHYNDVQTDNLNYLLTFLINCLLIVYSKNGRFFYRNNHIIIQQYKNRKDSKFLMKSNTYDPIIYAIAIIKQNYFKSELTSFSYAKSIWYNYNSLEIKERIDIMFFRIIVNYDLYHLSDVLNLFIFSLKITDL